jgi:UDP-glucuronate 4-epimerase
MKRDFTYVDDLVEAIVRLIGCVPVAGRPVSGPDVVDTLSPVAPWRVVNIGVGQPVELLSFIETIENCLGKRAIRKMLPMQSGDMQATYADPRLLEALTGFRPKTRVEDGVAAFIRWYLEEWPSRPTIAA